MDPAQESHIVAQFRHRAEAILRTEGVVGLLRRVAGRFRRKPLHRGGDVLVLRLDCPAEIPIPAIEVTIERLQATDLDTLKTLAEIDIWGNTLEDLLSRLAEGQECYIARHKDQIASVEWCRDGEFLDPYLERLFRLGDNEVYFYDGFTPSPFRGKGIHPYLQAKCARDIALRSPHKTRVLTFVESTNRASLRSLIKAGFVRCGKVGFVELLGIRLHYILGRDALPATLKRFYLERR